MRISAHARGDVYSNEDVSVISREEVAKRRERERKHEWRCT